jgi:hypothetical protein
MRKRRDFDDEDEEPGPRRRRYVEEYEEEDDEPVRRSRPRSSPFDEDDEEEEDVPAIAPEEDLENILDLIDRHRLQLETQTRLLHQLLKRHPDLKAEYEDFLRCGGVTGEDFERYQQGRMRPRLLNHRGNLRLVSKSQPVQLSGVASVSVGVMTPTTRPNDPAGRTGRSCLRAPRKIAASPDLCESDA